VSIDDAEVPKLDANAAELSKLRNEVVAQARELAIIRWELSSLIRQHPVSGRVTQAKYSALASISEICTQAWPGARCCARFACVAAASNGEWSAR